MCDVCLWAFVCVMRVCVMCVCEAVVCVCVNLTLNG